MEQSNKYSASGSMQKSDLMDDNAAKYTDGETDTSDGAGMADSFTSQQGLCEETYVVYRRRWFIVATMAVLNISNAMAWICFAAVTNFTAEYFQVSVDAVNWFSLVYLVVAIPVGLIVAWELDTYGLRIAILCGAWFNFAGLLLRYLGTVFPIPVTTQYAIVMTGQTLAAIGQPFLLFSPTKMAALWFAENQRASANILATMSNPLGILLSFLLSALLVSEASDIPTMLWVFVIPATIGVLMATFGVCSDGPPTPPSRSAESKYETFEEGLKMLVRNKKFLILFVTFGAGFGIFNAISTFLEQIVCPIGYNDNFAGLVGALMIGVGLVGAVIAGLIVDRTKAFTPVVKVCNALAVLFIFVLAVSSKFNYAGAGVLVGGVGFGLFGLAQFSISLELGVECSYPVAEGTSACLLQISGQIQGIILIILGQVLGQPISITSVPEQQCIASMVNTTASSPGEGTMTMATSDFSSPTPEPDIPTVLDMTIPLFSFAAYGVLVTAILIIFFRTKYHRMEAEQAAKRPLET